MRLKDQARIIRQLRNQIVSMTCRPGCHGCCGIVPMTLWELKRTGGRVITSIDADKKHQWCPCLDKEKGCLAYTERPILCRVYGAIDLVVPSTTMRAINSLKRLHCPYKCIPARPMAWTTTAGIMARWMSCGPKVWVTPQVARKIEWEMTAVDAGYRGPFEGFAVPPWLKE